MPSTIQHAKKKKKKEKQNGFWLVCLSLLMYEDIAFLAIQLQFSFPLNNTASHLHYFIVKWLRAGSLTDEFKIGFCHFLDS